MWRVNKFCSFLFYLTKKLSHTASCLSNVNSTNDVDMEGESINGR